MQQKFFIAKDYYKRGNSLVRLQRKFCTVFALRKGPTKVPLGVWLGTQSPESHAGRPSVHSTAVKLVQARRASLSSSNNSLRPVSQLRNMGCSTEREITALSYQNILAKYIYVVGRLLDCCALLSGRSSPTFRTHLLLASSER